MQASATKLRELQERDLSGEDVDVRRVDDGRRAGHHATENEKVLTPFLRSLVERGLDVSQGLLVIVDGGGARATSFPPPRPCNGVSGTARERGELRGQA